MPNKSRKKDIEDSIPNCIEIAWAEKEVEKWMTRQTVDGRTMIGLAGMSRRRGNPVSEDDSITDKLIRHRRY